MPYWAESCWVGILSLPVPLRPSSRELLGLLREDCPTLWSFRDSTCWGLDPACLDLGLSLSKVP